MAELTKNHPLAAADGWVEVTGPLGIGEGERWVLEVAGDAVEAVVTDSNDAPAAATQGQLLFPGTHARAADLRVNTRGTGEYWWVRSAGDSTVIAAAV